MYLYLVEKGDSGETKTRLKEFMSPTVMRGRARKPMFDDVYAEARKLRLLTEIDDDPQGETRVVAAKPSIRGRSPEALARTFLSAVERRLLFPDEAADCDQQTFPPTLAWFLMQSPKDPIPSSGNPASLIQNDLDDQSLSEVRDPAHFGSFVHWASYLGYASQFGADNDAESSDGDDDGSSQAPREPNSYVLPDPTRALARHLPSIFERTSQLTVREFMAAWSAICPVVEGGAVRNDIEALVARLQRRPNWLSASTSLALTRLANRNLIHLDVQSDAATIWILDDWRGGQRVSHIKYRG
jgi:hypothetical protein